MAKAKAKAKAKGKTDNIIELRNISKSFRAKKVISSLSLSVKKDDSLVIIGMGDSGKSVLLKIMLLIMPYDKGRLFFGGKEAKELSNKELMEFRNTSGILFQNNALFDSLSVRDNIAFYLDHHSSKSYNEITKLVRLSLDMVNLEQVEALKPASLSGGMKKRVGLARAIIHKPSIIFLDEPTAGLDPIISDSISSLINSIRKELGVTLITVTNDIACARKVGDTIAMLYEGGIYKVGSKQDILEGDDPLINQFINGTKEGPIRYHDKELKSF